MARKKFITVICYNKVEIYPESKRKELEEFYLEGMCACEGSEQERYANVYCDLKAGCAVCTDGDPTIRFDV